jgi:5-formyltetrahydrofolate cyclo-ligase
VTAQAGGASPLLLSSAMTTRAVDEAKAALRRRLRAARRALDPVARREAEQAIRRELRRSLLWRPGRRIAVYLPLPGEVDLTPSFADAWRHGVHLYVPRILDARTATMAFVPLTPDAQLCAGALGTSEPARRAAHEWIDARRLDAVLVPLVGFDEHGHRLGMGAGYYDRALRHRRDRQARWRRPRLIGIAYSLQRVPSFEPSPWDVALDTVVTEHGILHCKPSAPKARTP